jgi:hypothetical protein
MTGTRCPAWEVLHARFEKWIKINLNIYTGRFQSTETPPQKCRLPNRAGRVGNPAGYLRKTAKNQEKTTETQGPCPDLRGLCISAPYRTTARASAPVDQKKELLPPAPEPAVILSAPRLCEIMKPNTSSLKATAAATTTRFTFKIEDPSRSPGRVEFRDLDEGSGLEGPRNLHLGF